MANRKLGNLRNIIPSFPMSEFSILPYSRNRKLGFKEHGKFFSSFRHGRASSISFTWAGLKLGFELIVLNLAFVNNNYAAEYF